MPARRFDVIAAILASLSVSAAAHASSYAFRVGTEILDATPFLAERGAMSFTDISNCQTANTGPITYGGANVADVGNEASFLASSASTSDFGDGSLYQIVIGDLAAGTILTIPHDDGVSLNDNQTAISTVFDQPTTSRTDSIDLASAADIVLYDARENRAPFHLDVSIPEPASLGLLSIGALGVGLAVRRRRSRA